MHDDPFVLAQLDGSPDSHLESPMRLAPPPAAALLSLFTLAAAAAADPPAQGDPAPDVPLKATQVPKGVPDSKSGALSLKDLKGKTVVLFYFPKALTKGCTVESCGFRDLIPE